MSGATYRIEYYKSQLQPDAFPWKAHVVRVSDDELVAVGVGATRDEAVAMARDLVTRINAAPDPGVLYVDDDGRDASPGHSVKVTE